MYPVPNPLIFKKQNLVAPGIEPGTPRSVARNSDQYTTEAVHRVPMKTLEVDMAEREI
jgi:hypothetical protein